MTTVDWYGKTCNTSLVSETAAVDAVIEKRGDRSRPLTFAFKGDDARSPEKQAARINLGTMVVTPGVRRGSSKSTRERND